MSINLSKIEFSLAVLITLTLLIWQPVSLIAVFCLFLIKLIQLKQNIFKSIFFYLFLCFIIYVFAKLIWLNQLNENINHLEKILILLLVYLSFNNFSTKTKQHLSTIFIWSMFGVQLYSLIHIALFFSQNNIEYQGINNFSYINDALGFERPYIAILITISILFQLFGNQKISKKRYVQIILILYSFGFLIFIAAKFATVIAVLLIIVKAIISNKGKIILVPILLAILLFSLFYKSLSIGKRFSSLNKDERIFLWSNAIQIKDNDKDFLWLTGNSTSAYKEMNSKLQKLNIEKVSSLEKKNFYAKNIKNIHNQYLEIYLFGGAIGLFLLLLPFIYMLYKSIIEKNWILFLLVSTFLLFLFIENVLERQLGVFIIGFFMAISSSNFEREEIIHK